MAMSITAARAPEVRIELSTDFEAELPGLYAAADAARAADGEIQRSSFEAFRAYYRNLEHCTPSTDIAIARHGEEIVGYARISWSDTTDGERWYESVCFVHPDHRRRGIGRRLLAWTESRRLELAAADELAGAVPDRPRRFTAFNNDGGVGGDVLLRAAGYEPFRRFYSMLRPDLANIAEHPLPAGLEIRPIPNEPDAIRAVVRADNEAFADHFGSVDDEDVVFAQIVADPETDTSLWVVAFDGDEVAGAVLNGIHADPDGVPVGWLDSVFTRRPWRKRGLARALIARSLVLLRERGISRAALGVDASNPNQALGLYESCGFRRASSTTGYRKAVPSSPDSSILEGAAP
jgi:mycothiol synthase